MRMQTLLSPPGAGDEPIVRRSARRLGHEVMVICVVLVLLGGLVILGFVLWQTTLDEMHRPLRPGEVELRLDLGELVIALTALAVGAAICANIAARLVARRAVRPLAEALERERRFIDDASHELRTPLAVLDARVQHLVALRPVGEAQRVILDELREDVRIMSAVVDDLIVMVTDGGSSAGSADLSAVLEATCRDLRCIATPTGVSIDLTPVASPMTVGLPAIELRRCLTALLDNAIEHSPPGGVVRVATQRSASVVLITIADEGSGIAGIDPTRVFDRGAQGARPGRVRPTGRGIGLALARDVAEAYGGGIRVVDPGPGGTSFELRLPLIVGEFGS